MLSYTNTLPLTWLVLWDLCLVVCTHTNHAVCKIKNTIRKSLLVSQRAVGGMWVEERARMKPK